MTATATNEHATNVTLHPVDRTNWRAITKLAVAPEQRDFVVEPCYYLVLYAYDQLLPLPTCIGEIERESGR